MCCWEGTIRRQQCARGQMALQVVEQDALQLRHSFKLDEETDDIT